MSMRATQIRLNGLFKTKLKTPHEFERGWDKLGGGTGVKPDQNMLHPHMKVSEELPRSPLVIPIFMRITLYAFLFLPSSLIIYFLVYFIVGGGDGPPGLN